MTVERDRIGRANPWPSAWIGLAVAAAALSAIGSAIGQLAGQRIYGQETEQLADLSAAQDLVNLTIVAPVTLVVALRAARGSARAMLLLPGCMAFTAYNYAIYAFSIHFGPLFLLWVVVLGLSSYSLLMASMSRPQQPPKELFRRALPLQAWTLIGLGTLFTLLWLALIIPDLIAGRPSTSAAEWRTPTNPVHALDLALFIPGVIASGVLLLRRRPAGYATAPSALTFLGLTCLPILMTPLVAAARGHQVAASVAIPIGLVLVVVVAASWSMLRHVSVPVRAFQLTP